MGQEKCGVEQAEQLNIVEEDPIKTEITRNSNQILIIFAKILAYNGKS